MNAPYRPRPSSRPAPTRLAGFTLVELMISIAVLAILLAMAVPSLREVGLNSRGSGMINTLLADLSTARSEAVKTARPTYIVAIGGDWANGWNIWTDTNLNGAQDGDEPTLKSQDPINGGYTSAETAFLLRAIEGASGGGSNVGQIAFGAQGQTVLPSTGARFGLCRPDGNAARSTGIQVSVAGRAQAVKGLPGLTMGCS